MISPDDTRGVLVTDLRSVDGPYVPSEMATADIPLPDDTLYPRPAISLHSSRIGNDGMPVFDPDERYEDLAARATEVARATGQSPQYVEALMLRAIEDGELWPAAPMIRNDDATPEDIIDAVLGANSDAEIIGYALTSAERGEIAEIMVRSSELLEHVTETAALVGMTFDELADGTRRVAEALSIEDIREASEAMRNAAPLPVPVQQAHIGYWRWPERWITTHMRRARISDMSGP